MLGLRPFQMVLLTGSTLIFIGAIIFLALYEDKGCEGDDCPVKITDTIYIWGTVERELFDTQLNIIKEADDRFEDIRYVQHPESRFIFEFVDALAEGRGPDLIVISHTQLAQLRSKIYPIQSYPERDYREHFIEGAEIFLLSDGLYALPFAVDPLVMYWNRDIFSSNNIASPPTTWETLRNSTVPTLTKAGGSFDLVQSAVAFGEYSNVRNAKEVLSMLMLQSGSTIVDEFQDSYRVTLQSAKDEERFGMGPGAAALSFYTEFANPSGALYSWNRSMPEDRQRFLSGDLALYFGLGSEQSELVAANPNLNFDMTLVPQGANATILRNYGEFYGFALPRQAKDVGVSYQVARSLAVAERAQILAEGMGMSSVRRSVHLAGTNDLYQEIRNESALLARGWLEPTPEDTESIFRSMVEDVTSGRLLITSAISDAVERLRLAF